MNPVHQVTVSRVDSVGPAHVDAYLLHFKRPFDFHAGQVVGVTVDKGVAPRLYSIASGEGEETVGIFFDVKPDGELSPLLADVTVGDSLYVTAPHGTFTMDGDADDVPCWWIATGTGIAPFRSMVRSGKRAARLIQGARSADGLYFREEFSEIDEYVKCLSREPDGDAQPMRLTAYLAGLASLPTDARFYLCGNTDMVMDVRQLLIARGVPFANIVTEIYF